MLTLDQGVSKRAKERNQVQDIFRKENSSRVVIYWHENVRRDGWVYVFWT